MNPPKKGVTRSGVTLFTRDSLLVLIGLLLVNGLGLYYGLDAWSPWRLIPNLAVVVYAAYRLTRS